MDAERPRETEVEKRHDQRMRTLKACKIVLNHEHSTIDCRMRNRNPVGAKLLLDQPFIAPDGFELLIESTATLVPVRRVWQKGYEIGVHFEGVERPTIRKTSRRY